MNVRRRASISTHVLDTERGEPAAGVPVVLARLEAGQEVPVGRGETDLDGRIAELLEGDLRPGIYRLTFDVAGYRRRRGGPPVFLARVSLDVLVEDVGRHYHVPLLLSPYACTAYRGS